MLVEVTSVSIDTKNQKIEITGNKMDEILNEFDLDYIPSEVTFKFDWSEGIGPKIYLTKMLQQRRQKQPEKSFKEILEGLSGSTIFINNNFRV